MSNAFQNKKVDVLVLGAGVAGAVAASVLAKRGFQVAIVDKTGGATGQSSGAVDVAHLPGYSNAAIGYIETAKLIAKSQVGHPYAKIGEGHLDVLKEALIELKALAHDIGYVARDDGKNLALATQLGTIKYASMVQQTQGFDLGELSEGDSIAVLGFSGLPSFDASIVARMLSWSVGRLLNKNIAVEPIQVDLRPHSLPSWRSPIEMALSLDGSEQGEAFQSKLHEALRGSGRHKAFLLPSILGRTHYKKLWQLLNEREGMRCFELLALPHSAPALRLRDALIHGLRHLSTAYIQGEAKSASLADGRISSLTIEDKDSRYEIAARSVILATGRFFSGGFERQGVRREKIFGLPLWHEGTLIEDMHVATLTTKGISSAQSIFCAGLNIDKKLRPLDRMMELFALNLFSAGSSIGGYDSGGSGAGLGLAALTGYLSAVHASESMAPQEER